jgi:hypothetical protein
MADDATVIEAPPDPPEITNGFPPGIRAEALEVTRLLPRPRHPALGSVGANVGGARIAFAYRIYNAEIPTASLASLSPTGQLVAHCVYSRHHDGYVRQRSSEELVKVLEPWVAPYVAYLAGEYVLEIVEVILDAIGDLADPDSPLAVAYGAFAASNPELVDLIERRATSYWSCYYRGRYPRESYPGLLVVGALKRAAHAWSTQAPALERAIVPRESDLEPPRGVLSVYWEKEADVPGTSIVDDDPGRLPVTHLGLSFDGTGFLVVLFNALWGERNDFWCDTEAEAHQVAAQYGVAESDWRDTGGRFDDPIERPI